MIRIFIAGWGKNVERIAYLGVMKCNNCNNHDHFHLYEGSDKISLYFIPIGKFRKKYFVACSICEAGWEIDENTKTKILADSKEIPAENVFSYIWNDIDSSFAQLYSEGIEDLDELIEKTYNKVKVTYLEKHIKVVLDSYVNYLIDLADGNVPK